MEQDNGADAGRDFLRRCEQQFAVLPAVLLRVLYADPRKPLPDRACSRKVVMRS